MGGSDRRAATPGDPVLEHVIAPVAAEIAARADELAAGLAEGYRERLPELFRDELMRPALLKSTSASVRQVAEILERDVDLASIELPVEVVSYARESARLNVPIGPLMRTYRVGHAALWEFLVPELVGPGGQPGGSGGGGGPLLGQALRLRRHRPAAGRGDLRHRTRPSRPQHRRRPGRDDLRHPER